MDNHFVTYHYFQPIAALWAIVALLFVAAAAVLWRLWRPAGLAPRHRWFQFSMRTLFVTMALLACWLGWQVHVVENRLRMKR